MYSTKVTGTISVQYSKVQTGQIKYYLSHAPNTTGVVDLAVKCLLANQKVTQENYIITRLYTGGTCTESMYGGTGVQYKQVTGPTSDDLVIL